MVTADATGTAQWIRDQGGHYVLTVKGDQKALHRSLKDLPWKSVPSVSSVDVSHGRRVVRHTLKAVEAPKWMDQAQPEVVGAWIRGHWEIENRLHWVRDVVFDEEHHQLRTANGPEIMAALRNLSISLIRLFHGTRAAIASATRSLSRRPKRAIDLIARPPR